LKELKLKLSTPDSDEGIRIESGRGTKIFLNKRPDTYVVEIVGKKNSNTNISTKLFQVRLWNVQMIAHVPKYFMTKLLDIGHIPFSSDSIERV